MARTYSVKPGDSIVRYQRASVVEEKICVGNIESVPAACTSIFCLLLVPGFQGTHEQMDSDLVHHYAEEMGRGVGP